MNGQQCSGYKSPALTNTQMIPTSLWLR